MPIFRLYSALCHLSFWILTLCNAQNTSAEELVAGEYEMKSAFIYNFIKFVEFPTSKLLPSDNTLIVCITKQEAEAHKSINALNEKEINNKKIRVKVVTESEASGCHVLYLNYKNNLSTVKRYISNTTNQAVLTVGEHEQFLAIGGIINFVIEDNRVRFEINRTQANSESINISSRLLSIAKSVE